MQHPVNLPFSLLTLSLIAGFAHADETQQAQLQEVVVKGAATSATHRVTVARADQTTSTELKEVLFNEPSIGFGGGSATSQWVNIRGLGQDQIDYKVDNAYTDTSIFHHQGRFILDPALVKVVAVQKGSGSASAGIGATSGAIIAETIDPSDLLRDGQDVGFKINLGVSSNKGWNRGLAAYGRVNGFDGLVAGNWVTEKDYKAGKGFVNSGVSGGERVPNSALGQRGVLAKIGYNFDDQNRLELSHRQEKTYGERLTREEFIDFDRNADVSYRVLEQNTTNVEFQGANLGFISRLKANAYRMDNTREQTAVATGAVSPKIKNTIHGANLNLDSTLFDRHTLKYGINWRAQKNNPGVANSPAAHERKEDVGVYVEGIWDIAPVTLTTGLRYDHFDVRTSGHTSASDGDFNPSVGVIYDVNDALSLNASLNYATRSPRLYESALAASRNIVTAPNLKAERARSTEVGFTFRPNNQFSLSGNYFWQTVKNVHDFVCLSGRCSGRAATYASGITQSTNNGYLKNKGYELNTSYRWQGLTARAGVAYSSPEHHTERESYDPNTKAHAVGRTWTAGLSYQFARPQLELGWRGRFVQARTGTPGRGSSASDAPINRPGYGVNDIYANWKPTGKDNLNINLAINNIGNKLYYPHSQRTGESSLPEVGRDFRLGVNYRF